MSDTATETSLSPRLPEGYHAVIVGGSSGLGAATAGALAACGARVTIIDLDGDAAEVQAGRIGAAAEFADVTDGDALEAAFRRLAERAGPPRFVINCAGIAPAKKVVGRDGPQPLDAFRTVVDVNLNGSFNVLRLAAAQMRDNAPDAEGCRGLVLLTASIAAWEGQIGQAAYAASKAGVTGLVLPAARELAAHGIRVMGIAPGVFETPMVTGMPEDVQKSLYATVPFPHRFGRPQEFAALALAILANPMLNGTTIRLDGANRMGAK